MKNRTFAYVLGITLLVTTGIILVKSYPSCPYPQVRDIFVQECTAFIDKHYECGNAHWRAKDRTDWVKECIELECEEYQCNANLAENDAFLLAACIVSIHNAPCNAVQMSGPCSDLDNLLPKR